ncbi:MAG: hypothetical protein Kow00106_18550 [Anaerolineae bacterium]
MTEAGTSPSSELLRSLQLLRSADPEDRKRAIRFLSTAQDDPRVLQVLEHLYEKDPDPGVRQLAWRAIQLTDPSVPAPVQRQAAPSPPPTPRAAPAPPPRMMRPRREHWTWREPFLLNPSNAPLVEQERERRARRRKVGRWTFVAGAALLLMVAVLWGVLVPFWVRWFDYEWNGVNVPGVVEERLQAGDNDYRVRYRYTVNNADYGAEQRVTREEFDRLTESTPVTVIVLPDDPASPWLVANTPEGWLRNWLTALVVALTLLALLLMLSAILRRRRALRIEAPAILTGQLLACEGAIDDDGDFKVRVSFRFRSPSGQTLTGQARQIRNDLRARPLPPVGAPVAIYYRHDRSYRML